MKRKLLSLLFIIIGIGGAVAQSADTNVDTTLDERVSQLEKRAEVWDKLKPALQFSGYIQSGYDYQWNEDGTATSSFHLRRARMTMQGDVYNGAKGAKANYRLQIDLCRTPVIVDLWMKYQPVNPFGIQVGQFKIPVAIENTDYSATRLEFINYAQVVQRLARLSGGDMTGVASTGRDIGVQLFGGFIKRDGYSIINYEVGVFNGAGICTKDNNLSKDIAARLTIQPLKLLKIAGYYLIGDADVRTVVDKYPAMVNGSTNHNLQYINCTRYGGGFDYSNKFLFARAEYIGGKTGDLTSQGAYVMVGYKFLGKCSVGVRFDYFDENVEQSGDQTNYSVALSYHPWKHLRLQAEYTRQNYFKIQNSKDSNCLYFMVTALF